MASIVWNDVIAFAPELSVVAAGAQTDLLAFVNAALAVDEFGGEADPRTRLARIYLAAHMASQGLAGAVGGPVASESAGGLARSYAVIASGGSTDLDATAYGRMYRTLVRTSLARAVVLL